jgi:hypothetical protein
MGKRAAACGDLGSSSLCARKSCLAAGEVAVHMTLGRPSWVLEWEAAGKEHGLVRQVETGGGRAAALMQKEGRASLGDDGWGLQNVV